ncbi:PAS domain-containing protein [Lacibacterium aquatile]|uniref:PAS domain-containing protein n=1 Tax=Lacibacterium aquatile TaxID=1168082 RepID=A0ABW5DRE6_9PROT
MDDLLSSRARLYANHYRSLLTSDAIPLRSTFDIRAVKTILDSFVILEPLSLEIVRFRLVGTREVQRYGQDVTGGNYLDFCPPERRLSAYAAFETMANHACGMQAVIRSKTSVGVDILNEAVGFPFRCDRTGAIHLIFQSNDLDRDTHWKGQDAAVNNHATILLRTYLDIGFGIPAPVSV